MGVSSGIFCCAFLRTLTIDLLQSVRELKNLCLLQRLLHQSLLSMEVRTHVKCILFERITSSLFCTERQRVAKGKQNTSEETKSDGDNDEVEEEEDEEDEDEITNVCFVCLAIDPDYMSTNRIKGCPSVPVCGKECETKYLEKHLETAAEDDPEEEKEAATKVIFTCLYALLSILTYLCDRPRQKRKRPSHRNLAYQKPSNPVKRVRRHKSAKTPNGSMTYPNLATCGGLRIETVRVSSYYSGCKVY